MQCYNFPSPPPSPTSFFLCVKVRVCKQRNICNLLICWILKWSFAYYLIPNIFLFRIPDESSGDEELATLILWYIFQELTVAF